MKLAGKVALITGAARGIGKAIAERFASDGAAVAIGDVANEDAARETLSAIERSGGKGMVRMFDVGDAAQVDAAVADVLSTLGRIDILVNNAGITRDNLLMRMSEEDFDAVVRTNLKGTFLLTRSVSRHMVKQRGGRIINMSSGVGMMGNAGQAN